MASISTDRLQGVNVGAAVKVPCRLATTANITLSGLQTIDGVVTVQDDRVLVKNQTTSSENGIYLADSGAWERDKDWDGSYDVKKGTIVHVTEGSTYTRTWWEVTTSDPITPGTTGVTIIQGITDSAIITFLPSGISASNAATRTAQAKMGDIIALQDAKDSSGSQVAANGTTDDASGINAAITDVSATAGSSGRKIIIDGNGKSYGIGSSVLIKQGVILRNLRLVPLSASMDMVKLAPGAEFHGIIDTQSVTFTGKGLVLDPANHSANYDNTPGFNTRFTLEYYGNDNQGKAIYLHENSATEYIAFVEGHYTINGSATAVEIYTQNGTGFISGNTFFGTIRRYTTGIHVHGNTSAGGNLFYGQLQPVAGVSVRGIYFEHGAGNTLIGQMWDTGNNSTAAIEWASTASTMNRAILTNGRPDVSKMVNGNSDKTTNSVCWQLGNSFTFFAPDDTIEEMTVYNASGLLNFDIGSANTILALSNIEIQTRQFFSTHRSNLTLVNGNNNDIVLTTSYAVVAGPTGAFNVTGLSPTANGRTVTLHNGTLQDMVLVHESAASFVSNRINLPGGANITFTGSNNTATFKYDATLTRWYLIGRSA